MTKVGLKDTLALLAKGYSKKEIDALAAIDEEQESNKEAEAPAPIITDSAPAPAPVPEVEEPDYKAMYEELQKKNKETEETLKKIQQKNIHENLAPAVAEQKKAEADALPDLVRGFM